MDTAWIAGLYEGEGYMGAKVNSKGRGRQITIAIVSTDLDVLQRAQEMTGWKLYGPYRNGGPNTKPIYRITTGKLDNVIGFMSKVWPYLGSRRKTQALDALEKYSMI